MTIGPDPTREETEVIDLNEDQGPDFAWPTVVAVVVTHNPGSWLEECLVSLAAQDYPDLTTLVVDVCSDEDLTERVAKAMPTAFVRRTNETNNFASAVNEAVYSIQGATYVLICHDDVVIGPNAIAELVEEAFRSNASVVGPKIIDAAHEEKLLEVGGMIDRFGVPFRGIEPDEVDQGQHDGVRDVFFVSSAAMLVRADLFRALGGFDPECFPGAEDIDLAWRAHLVSARVLVQPDAVIKHHLASDRQRKSRTSTSAIVARHRMRAVLKNASVVSLAWILPVAFILHSIEGIAWLLRANPRRAWLLFSGWIWNIRHLKDTRKVRAAIQKTREVSDRVIAAHQIGGSARIRRFLTSIIQNRQLKKLTTASRSFATTTYSHRTRETPIYLAAMFVYLLAVRSLIFDGVAAVGEFVQWPSLSVQVDALLRGGLPVGDVAMTSSTFGRVIALAITLTTGNNPGLAQTLFVISMIPVGGFGVRLLLKERDMGPLSIAISAITYGMFALCMHAFSYGDFGSIVMLAAFPYFVRALDNHKKRQAGISAAVMVAFYPSAIVVCFVVGIVFIFAGDDSFIERESLIPKNIRKRTSTVLQTAFIATLINIGMVIDFTRGIDRSTFGFTHSISDFTVYFADQLSVAIALWVALPICVCALLVSRSERMRDLRVLILSTVVLGLVAYMFIYFAQPIFEVSALYAVIQLAVAIAVGICLHSFKDEMKLRSFGILHFVTFFAIVAVITSVIMSAPVLRKGTFGLPTRSWATQIDAQDNERILYVGDSRALLGRDVVAPYGRSFSLVATEPLLSASFVGPASSNDDQVRAVYSAIMDRSTTHGGYLLAQLGIGTIAIPTSRAPGSSLISRDAALLEAFDRQSDLVRIKDREGLVVFENTEYTRAIGPTHRVNVGTPFDELNQRAQGDVNNITTKASISTRAMTATTLCILFLLASLLWRRRHQLLSTRQFVTSNIQKVQKSSDEVIDLEKEHAIDEERVDEKAMDEKQEV